MASVDDRIVRMEFDNAAFEKKLNTTLTSLGQLDKALKFTGAQKGLSDVSAAASKMDFTTISDGIENVSQKFIALSTIAITVLAGITTQAIAAGEKLVKAFAIQPVLDGFHEYETNMNSIQTILANTASKGTTLDQVSAALDKLNTYSDQTIYNFGQMAKNIGTFTAAGVDLQTSVDSIKGIANLAAMSGSNADQASTAMYQLSQAIASGSVHLMDWNSVVNAGMGGEAFKTALFETGKAMHTLTDVPLDMTLKQWEDAGHSFRDSLQDGWITADVLTTTLQGFTGDMTEEMLLQKGFSEAQAQNIIKTAAVAKAAATEVKTFTQLVGTVKEAVGTGFADSFKIIIGNFNEAKTLFTGINNAIGAFVTKSSDARNSILQGWKDLGGRSILINDLENAFHNLAAIIDPIKQAFKDMFPPVTAQTLLELTGIFTRFVNAMAPSVETVDKLHRIFAGLFALLRIGWEVIKDGAKFIGTLAKELSNLISPEASDFLANLGDGLVRLKEVLVDGGGIQAFFAGLGRLLEKPLALLGKFRDALGNMFGLFPKDLPKEVGDDLGRLGDRFENVKALFEKAAEFVKPLEDAFNKVKEILGKVWDAVSEFFSNLGDELAKVMNKGNFDSALDAINTGLLGGITLLIAKFLKNGFNIDIKSVFSLGGGLIDQIRGTFGELTNTLKAMQTQIKAQALLKIAEAIALLTASVLVLSMIDSEALTKALAAMAVGFTQLMGAFAVFTKLAADPKSAATFTLMSTGLILLSTALLIMAGAVKVFASMSWEELARGLGAITLLLGALILITKPLAANSKGMISASVGIAAIASAMVIMGIAVKIFASMSWEELGRGLLAVGIILLGLIGFMQLLPPAPVMISEGLAIVAIAVAMNILASAVAIFGTMELETLGKGLGAVAVGLLIIAGAMHLMPENMIVNAAALVLVGVALNIIGVALKIFASMSWEEIARGLVALGGSLAIIAGAMYLMEEALPGALALIVVATALGILAAVLKVFGKMDFETLLESLGKLALALGIIAAVALLLEEAIPVIFLLGVALMALGAGFALFGLGVLLIGKGLEAISKAGKEAASNLGSVLEELGKAMPQLLIGLAEGIIQMVEVLTKAAPVFAKALGALLEALIPILEGLIPKVGKVIVLLIEEIFRIIRSYAQEYINTGIFIIMTLLHGIEDNIGPIVETVGNIVVNFLTEMQKQIPRIAQGIADTITTAFTSAANALGQVAWTLMYGVAISFLEGFFQGLQASIGPIADWFINLAGSVLGWIGDVIGTLWQKGSDILTGLWNGIQSIWGEITGFFSSIRGTIFGFFGDAFNWLKDAGESVVSGFWQGIKNIWSNIVSWIKNHVDDLIHTITHPWEIFSPSHLMKRLGENIMEGWHIGLKEGWKDVDHFISNLDATDSITNIGNNMTDALTVAIDQLNNMGDFNPVITPVLDLTQVAKDASKIGDYIDPSTVTPAFSYNQANIIARQKAQSTDDVSNGPNATEAGVKFEQNIYSPTQLSTSDIYKQTRNQIRIAKEELSIP